MEDLDGLSLDDWRRPPGRPRVSKYSTARPIVKEPERSELYGSELTTLQRLFSTFGATHLYLCMSGKEDGSC